MKLFDDKLIVVTGGGGFIGSGVVKCLNDRGMTKNVVIVDDLGCDEKWKNLLGKQFSEIIAIDELFDWLEGKEADIEAFIHMGACSDTTETDMDFLMENNYRYSIELAEYAILHGHRFIYASSAAVYGDGSLGYDDDHDLFDSLEPLNKYGFSKWLFDMWLKEQDYLSHVVGLRFFNVYGPNEGHKGRMASAITKMVPDVLNNGEVCLFKSSEPDQYKDGGQCRDFIYVKDAVRMTCAFLENNATGIFNVGTGEAMTWDSLANGVIKALDADNAKIRYIDMPEDLMGRYQNYTQAKIDKLKSALGKGAAASQGLEDQVKDYVQNYIMKGKRW